MSYTELVEAAVALGAQRPIWRGDESVARCWIDRAELLVHAAVDKRQRLIEECNRYSGQL